MKSSTAKYIAYDLRPAKQVERRILLDFLKCANEAGITISDSRYVGMGGTLFYDFHLVHRFLGISEMISLERDPTTFPRSRFNRPFDFVSVRNRTVTEFLASDTSRRRTIYWLDYDDGIGPDIVADITALGAKLRLGGFAFVTTTAIAPGVLANAKVEERLRYFQDELPEIAVGLTESDMHNGRMAETIRKILLTAFKNAFAARSDGIFEPLFQIHYRDSVAMITIGGCLCDAGVANMIRNRVQRDLPFLMAKVPYSIRRLNLTDRERALFDLAVTTKQAKSRQATKLTSLGFQTADFECYKELIRFLPRYHESII